MANELNRIEAAGVALVLDLAVGHIRSFEVEIGGRRVAPLYTAPWIDEPDIAGDDTIDACLKRLSGDFFCAPFGTSDVEPTPGHGWPANSSWEPLGRAAHPHGGIVASFALRKSVLGARLVKEITLRDGHPFAYQRHIFEGGSGKISAASHAMTHFSGIGHLSFSAKRFGETPASPLEPDPSLGRYVFAYPARFTDLAKVPLTAGGHADITRYPVASRHEDFAMLVEAPGASLGWAAACRADERDIVLSLKNPSILPMTMLWFSNGGRDYSPWNGRNVGVLGIEEARAYSTVGHAGSIVANPLSDAGIPTAFTLDPNGQVEIRHVVGALPLPDGWTAVADVTVAANGLKLTSTDGAATVVPFDAGFLG